MRQRIIKKQAGHQYVLAASCEGKSYKRRNAYNVAAVVLFSIIVGGTAIFNGTKKECDEYCVALRLRNVAAEVVKI